jgi:hypothetical protein
MGNISPYRLRHGELPPYRGLINFTELLQLVL